MLLVVAACANPEDEGAAISLPAATSVNVEAWERDKHVLLTNFDNMYHFQYDRIRAMRRPVAGPELCPAAPK